MMEMGENTDMAKTKKAPQPQAPTQVKRSREQWAEIFAEAEKTQEPMPSLAARLNVSTNALFVKRSRWRKAQKDLGVKVGENKSVPYRTGPVPEASEGLQLKVEVRSRNGNVVTFSGQMPDYELIRKLLED